MSLCGVGTLPAQSNKDKPSCRQEDNSEHASVIALLAPQARRLMLLASV